MNLQCFYTMLLIDFNIQLIFSVIFFSIFLIGQFQIYFPSPTLSLHFSSFNYLFITIFIMAFIIFIFYGQFEDDFFPVVHHEQIKSNKEDDKRERRKKCKIRHLIHKTGQNKQTLTAQILSAYKKGFTLIWRIPKAEITNVNDFQLA